MTRKQAALLLALALLAALAAWLAWKNPGPPYLPADDLHRSFESAEACLACHGPDAPSPRTASHPLGRDCLRCHAARRAAASP